MVKKKKKHKNLGSCAEACIAMTFNSRLRTDTWPLWSLVHIVILGCQVIKQDQVCPLVVDDG